MSYKDDVTNLDSSNVPNNRNIALESGVKYFWPTKPCLYGHHVVRFAKSDRCLQCFINNQHNLTLKKHNLTTTEWNALYKAQRGKCSICRSEFVGNGSDGTAPCTDHCHESGMVRGILCGFCNKMLGMAKDNPDTLRRAATYLDRANTILNG